MSDGSESVGAALSARRWHERPLGRAVHAVCSLFCLGLSYVFAYQVMGPSTQSRAWDAFSLLTTIYMFVIGYDGLMDARFGRKRSRQR